MAFFIKRGDTFPELKFSLTQRLMNKYDITDDMMQNIAVTFSMTDKSTGMFVVANSSATIKYHYNKYEKLDDPRYELVYKFKSKDTRMVGEFYGEFKLDFLGNNSCGSISFPTTGYMSIFVTKGITKTTVLPVSDLSTNTFDYTFDETFF